MNLPKAGELRLPGLSCRSASGRAGGRFIYP